MPGQGTDSTEDIIICRDVHKWFDDFHVLRGISVTVTKGEVVVIFGPSGSGKSTFIRTLNRLENHQKGEIIVDGIELTDDVRNIEAIRSEVGMVFQQFNLFPHMTVMENIIEAPVRVLGVDRDTACQEALALLRRINLEHKVNCHPEDLSGGEQQRIAIVRALAMKPEAMLFDEPTSSLDPEMVGEVLSVIKDLVNGGMTTLIVTHLMHFAREIADRVVVFDKGTIIESGSPEEIFTNPKTERLKLFLSRMIS